MSTHSLEAVAQAMVAPGKGILAADESTGTIEKRFASIKVENTEDNRRAYRDMLFSSKGLGQYISGVILYDETLRQKAANGTPFVEFLAKNGILPGIKVDTGAKDLALCPGETVTEGLDNLAKRCAEYVKLGAKFAKWRAVINIGNGHTQLDLHRRQRPRARALRRDLPGRGAGADRRARSADGHATTPSSAARR